MTQQYIAGELSVLLGDLEVVARAAGVGAELTFLRHQVETSPIPALPLVAAQALAVNRRLCWEALARGDIAGFVRETSRCAELHRFGVCAGLLPESPSSEDAASDVREGRGHGRSSV